MKPRAEVTVAMPRESWIEFPAPAPLMNMNSRQHWAAKARETRAWRHAANIAARQTFSKASQRKHPPCIVAIEFPVRTERIRDPHNYFPTVKAIIDGLVDAGMWADDTPQYISTVEPRLTSGIKTVSVHLVESYT